MDHKFHFPGKTIAVSFNLIYDGLLGEFLLS